MEMTMPTTATLPAFAASSLGLAPAGRVPVASWFAAASGAVLAFLTHAQRTRVPSDGFAGIDADTHADAGRGGKGPPPRGVPV